MFEEGLETGVLERKNFGVTYIENKGSKKRLPVFITLKFQDTDFFTFLENIKEIDHF